MEIEEWESLLRMIDESARNDKGINILEAIKTKLLPFSDVYQSWETDNFDIYHSFKTSKTTYIKNFILNYPSVNSQRFITSEELENSHNRVTILQTAAENNLSEVVQYLFDVGVDVNTNNLMRSTPLLLATVAGQLDVVKTLIKEENEDINKENICMLGTTPLFWACHGGYIDIVRLLVDNGADTNIRNKKNAGLLHTNAVKHLDLAKYLVEEKNLDENMKDKFRNTPIHYAVKCGDLSVIKYLIEDRNVDFNMKDSVDLACANFDVEVLKYFIEDKQADYNIRDVHGNTILHKAVQFGNLQSVKYLIENKNMDPMVINNTGDTLLHSAATATKNFIELANYLINEKGIPVDVVNLNKETPLHIAIARKNFELLKYLLDEQSADVEAKDDLKATALHRAVIVQRTDIVKYLIKNKNADYTALDSNDWSPIYFAAATGQLDLVKYFVEELNVDCITPGEAFEWTPLYLCALYSCDIDVVKYLISQGADINIPTTEGRTPAQASCVKGNLAVLKYLVDELGATLDTMDQYQHNALSAAVEKGNFEIAKYLISEKNLDVNLKDIQDRTMIHLAVHSQNLDLLKYLIEETVAKQLINCRRSDTRCTPLHESVGKGLLDISDYLISKGAIVNAGDVNTNFPLHIAAARGFLEVVRLLIAKRANLNPKNSVGMTPLQRAAKAGHLDIVMFLVESGAKTTILDKRGNSALDHARINQNYEVVDYLKTLSTK